MKQQPSNRYGINMKRFCREHEQRMEQAMQAGAVTEQLLAVHLEKIRWLQHERLIHLLVLIMTAFADLFFLLLTVAYPQSLPASALGLLLLTVLLAFYFAHYFFLENTTQRWYRIAESMMDICPHPRLTA